MKTRLAAVGRVAPVGNAVRYDDVVGLVTVTFSATAPTPVSGTPPRPVTFSTNDVPPMTGPVSENWPSMVG